MTRWLWTRFAEASHLLTTVWLGGVLIEDMAMAGRGRSSMLVRCLRDGVERNCHYHCQSSLAVSRESGGSSEVGELRETGGVNGLLEGLALVRGPAGFTTPRA